MRRDRLREAIEEARRFLKRAEELEKTEAKITEKFIHPNCFHCGPAVAAVTRSSLDLTMALSALRKTGHR